MKKIHIYENGFDLEIEIDNDKKVTLNGFSQLPFPLNGKQFVNFNDSGNQTGRLIEVTVFDNDTDTQITTHIQFIKGSRDAEIWATIINRQTQTESLPKLYSSASEDSQN